MQICLQSLLQDQEGWGRNKGDQVRTHLQTLIASHPEISMFRVSLASISRVDVSFARTSVIELARSERGQRGFCLTHVDDLDVLENFDAAARKHGQPLIVWNKNMHWQILGPKPSTGLREMLAYVLSVPVARTSEAAAHFSLKTPNASNKLKQLWLEGYILRREQSASSGGVEYEYLRIA